MSAGKCGFRFNKTSEPFFWKFLPHSLCITSTNKVISRRANDSKLFWFWGFFSATLISPSLCISCRRTIEEHRNDFCNGCGTGQRDEFDFYEELDCGGATSAHGSASIWTLGFVLIALALVSIDENV